MKKILLVDDENLIIKIVSSCLEKGGADAYITKSFKPDAFLAKIRELLGE